MNPWCLLVESPWPVFLRVFIFESVAIPIHNVGTRDIKIQETEKVDIKGSWSEINSKISSFKTQGAPAGHARPWRDCPQTSFFWPKELVIAQFFLSSCLENLKHEFLQCLYAFFSKVLAVHVAWLLASDDLYSDFPSLSPPHLTLAPHGCFLMFVHSLFKYWASTIYWALY